PAEVAKQSSLTSGAFARESPAEVAKQSSLTSGAFAPEVIIPYTLSQVQMKVNLAYNKKAER
ncbi:MAG: hypothetical protein LKF52_06170, partial [Butyrivibrio sp.]|nr:hypothetical protein [Butyrivibrio sp.]